MKKIYTLIYNFFIILKVLCPIISFFYTILWFIGFLQISVYSTLSIPFEPFAIFVNSLYPIVINYEGQNINMSYIVCSGLFIVFHYLFDFCAQRIVDLYSLEEKRILKKRSNEVKKINASLEKEYNKEITRYSSFALLLNITIKEGYNIVNNRKNEIDKLKKEFYEHIIRNVKLKYKNSKGIILDKMFLVCEDFQYFEDFIMNFVGDIKSFKEKNEQNDLFTEFSISIDAIRLNSNALHAMEFLEKVDSFNYKDKIVVTSAFKLRYEKNKNNKYKIVPLGISRFFSEPDDYIDFELYSLNSKN